MSQAIRIALAVSTSIKDSRTSSGKRLLTANEHEWPWVLVAVGAPGTAGYR